MTMTAAHVGPQQYEKIYPSCRESVRAARQDVALVLRTWGLSHLEDDVVLVTSELVTNAVEHTGTREIEASITRAGTRQVRLEVTDRSAKSPSLDTSSEDDECGRGMAIVEALSLTWGWERTFGGKRVWAELG